MIMGKWVNGTGEGFETVLAIRTEVFCGELGVRPEDERDALDEISAHVLIFDEAGSPAATGRLFPDAEGWHLGRLCVKKQSRGKGFGDMALRMLLYRAAKTVPDADIVLSARANVAKWYASFGFSQEGGAYNEVGFPHVKMRVNARDILWRKSCGG